MPHIYGLVSVFLKSVYFSADDSTPPTPPPRVDDIIAAAALFITPHPTAGLQQTPQEDPGGKKKPTSI